MTRATWQGEPLRISNSEIQTFKDCSRRWYLTYYRELGLKRDGDSFTGARQLGTRMHLALDALYTSDEPAMDMLNRVYTEDIETMTQLGKDADEIIELKKEQDLAKAMLEGFLEWRELEGLDIGMELVAAEEAIEVPFPEVPGVWLRGKLDQRWHRKRDGARLFRDWKTVQNLTDPPKTLPLDEQMKFYHLLEFLDSLDKTGREPQWRTDGGLYMMLRKVKRTATAKPPFYGQVEVRHNRAELKSMWYRVLKICEDIVLARQALDSGITHQYVAPPRPSRDCTWKCDFFAVCPLMDDGSNSEGLLREYYVHVDPHERYQAQLDGKEVTQ